MPIHYDNHGEGVSGEERKDWMNDKHTSTCSSELHFLDPLALKMPPVHPALPVVVGADLYGTYVRLDHTR